MARKGITIHPPIVRQSVVSSPVPSQDGPSPHKEHQNMLKEWVANWQMGVDRHGHDRVVVPA